MSTHAPELPRSIPSCPRILPVREQARVVNDLLRLRLDRLLPQVMQETGFDTWIIVCNEDNHDPVFNAMIPFDTWAPILQIIAFCLNPDGTVDRLNISLTNLKDMYQRKWDLNAADDQWTTLVKILRDRRPKRIGINQSDVIWAADGLTATLKERLVAALGPKLSARMESAEKLCVRWLETFIEEELPVYEQAVRLTHHIIAETFSTSVITPGVTTTTDLRWFFWQSLADRGLTYSFTPFFDVQRSDEMKKRFDPADGVIRQGDLIHCDVGLIYMRFITDLQENAYVLRTGESDAPQGLRDALSQTNRLQDIFMGEFRQGLTGNQILNTALAKAREAGLSNPRIYSHSVGRFLHEPGPLIGLPWEQNDTGARGEVNLDYDTCFTMELGVRHPVQEWGGQLVSMSCEQDIVFRRDGATCLDGRQTRLHLIG
ncbi:MAG TPA: M24 family metallopeptidase [Candidatus Brocadiia bacterium]|nr:M24 family metallopeptidase [Candidatus Brocadiia bacterium]